MITNPEAIKRLALDSGGYAMVALDQRESLRTMFVRSGSDASDEQLSEFKRVASAVLAPFASAILMDRVFSASADLDLGGTPLILAVDEFDQPVGHPLRDSWVDPAVTPQLAADFGAAALKQLVLWSIESDLADHRDVAARFRRLCDEAGLPGIIEGVVCAPADSTKEWDRDAAIVAAAAEFATYKPDLYKAEVPAFGRSDDSYLEKQCRAITEALGGRPWVVLSSGVDANDFPNAVRIACRSGASGFLAGRAIWADCVGGSVSDLQDRAVARLRRLVAIVEDEVDSGNSLHVQG